MYVYILVRLQSVTPATSLSNDTRQESPGHKSTTHFGQYAVVNFFVECIALSAHVFRKRCDILPCLEPSAGILYA
jgi:hypothetical protein